MLRIDKRFETEHVHVVNFSHCPLMQSLRSCFPDLTRMLDAMEEGHVLQYKFVKPAVL